MAASRPIVWWFEADPRARPTNEPSAATRATSVLLAPPSTARSRGAGLVISTRGDVTLKVVASLIADGGALLGVLSWG